MGVLCCSLFWYALLYFRSSFAIILKIKRELVALLLLSFGCLVTVNVLWLFLTVSWVGQQFVIVVFSDQTHLLFNNGSNSTNVRISGYKDIQIALYSISQSKEKDKDQELINQAPHLTQDTNGKVTTSQLDVTNESQEASPFPAGDHKASLNKRARNTLY